MVNSLLEVVEQKPTQMTVLGQYNAHRMTDVLVASVNMQISAEESLDEQGVEIDQQYLNLAKPLLTLMTQIKQCTTVPNVEKLHQQTVVEVTEYIHQLEQLHCSPFLIDCAAYCICAAIDETVLATQWGTQKYLDSTKFIKYVSF